MVVVDAVVDVVRAALIFALTSLKRASSSMMRQLISEENNNYPTVKRRVKNHECFSNEFFSESFYK